MWNVARKTVPWRDTELVKYNGYKLCYSFDEAGELVVRFPGGLQCSIAALKDAVYPVDTRKPSEAFL
jgi:hypothetical protein